MSQPETFDTDVFRTRVVEQPHEDRVYVERTQWNEQAILARNAELRKLEQRKMEWGRQVASIPEIALPALVREYPDIRSNDRVARGRALHRALLAHPEWLVVEKGKL
jgi:ABC-type uncharacterized transport system YnjBCD ATPase subunit